MSFQLGGANGSVDSTTDTNGEFPPDLSDFARGRSTSQPTFKRNLSLNLLPSAFPTSNPSPASFSGGFEYQYEQYNPDFLQQDYFQLATATPVEETTEAFAPNGPFGYRLPASQPSSPVRSIYPPGQAPYIAAGRQRGATFSGTYSPLTDQFNQVASAIPPHLSFTQVRSQLQASPVIGSDDVSMEDLTTPTIPQPIPPIQVEQRRPSVSEVMTGEMIDKLTLIDK